MYGMSYFSVSLHVPRAFFGAKEEIQQFPLLSVGYQDNLIGTVISENVQNIPTIDISYKHQALVYSDIRRDVIARINISETKGFSRSVGLNSSSSEPDDRSLI